MCVQIDREDLPGTLAALIEQLEPADLPRLELAYRGLSGLHAVLSQLLAPKAGQQSPAPTAAAVDLHQLDALSKRVAEHADLIERMADEIAGLHKLATGMADRIAVQSELLSRKAESPPAVRMTEGTLVVTSHGSQSWDTEPAAAPTAREPQPAEVQAPAPPPPANGKEHHKSASRRARQMEIAKALAASGPLNSTALCQRLDIPTGSICSLLDGDWFAKTSQERGSPYTLTDAGREALRAAGYIVPPAAETRPPEAAEIPTETSPPDEPATTPAETSPPGPEPRPDLDARGRAELQCRVIAETIAEAAGPLLPDEIARKAGLPLEVVVKRLAKCGPSAPVGAHRYFAKSERVTGAWLLTNSGRELAKTEEATA